MNDTTPGMPGARRPLELDAGGRIAEDVHCRHCGHNLRGNGIDAKCPECAVPVARSTRDDLLALCDPAWVSRMARGVFLATGGLALAVVAFIGISVGLTAAASTRPEWLLWSVRLLVMMAWGVFTFGVWLATSPDPGDAKGTQPYGAAWLARWGSVAVLVASMFLVVGSLGGPDAVGSFVGRNVIVTLGLVVAVVGIVSVAAGLRYLAGMLERVPRRSLAGQCRIVMWGNTVALSATLAVQFVGLSAGRGMETAFLVAGCGACSGVLVFGVAAVIVLIVAGGALQGAAEDARKQWHPS